MGHYRFRGQISESAKMKKQNSEVELLIEKLPEQYQQIFSYAKYDSLGSRKCDSRLKKILVVYNQIKKQLVRELKVLDLGCAQGYFSLNLAKEGAFVSGVDCNQENINLCNKLSNIHNLTNVEFKKDKIQNFLKNNPLQDYDLVLGLSVFHHICHEEGYQFTKSLIKKTAEVIPNGIYELALSSEPLYWAKSLNENEKEVLNCYSYINQISSAKTHLSKIKRPIYFVSNKLFLMEHFVTSFDIAFTSSHDFEDGAHNETRRYFMSNENIIKYISFKNKENRFQNRNEFENEVNFLENKIALRNKPKLVYKFYNNEYGVIAREIISGELLYKVINKFSFEAKKRIIMDIISQLVMLEKRNFYHNDLRVWNIILDKSNEVSLIDYGAISESKNDCLWPSNVFYSLIVLIIEIFSEDFKHNKPTRKLDLGKLDQLNDWREPVVEILQEKPENLSFVLIQQMFSKSYEKKNETVFNRITYEQNLSLNLHIEKLDQVKKILNELIFGDEIKHLQVDSLLRKIQEIFSKKNKHIKWLENVIDEISLQNNDFEKKIKKLNNKFKSISDLYEKCIMENNSLLIKYNEILFERDKIIRNISLKKDELNNLNKSNSLLSSEVNDLNKINSVLSNKIYNVSFTKHLYRAYKSLFRQGKYK